MYTWIENISFSMLMISKFMEFLKFVILENEKNPCGFKEILDLVPRWLFESCTKTYKTDKGCSKYRTYDQFVALTFGQLNKCQSLSDISAGIGVSKIFISDLGLTQSPARSTMSDGNKNRDWHVFERLYYRLLSHYKSVQNNIIIHTS